MKKLTLVLSVVIMAAILAVSAVAAPSVYETDTNAAFDVTYTGTAGAYYAIVAIEGIAAEGTAPAITEDSIQYIDQKTADADGAVAFEDLLLKVDGTPATIYLGGSDLDEAVLLGWVNKPADEPDTFTVSGTVTSGSDAAATVTLTSGDNVFTVNTNAGAYSVDVPAGTYKMVVTKLSHTSYTKNALVVEADVVKNVTIKAGDVNTSGVVNASDLGDLLKKFNTTDEGCDINASGVVNASDLGDLLKNFNATSVVED